MCVWDLAWYWRELARLMCNAPYRSPSQPLLWSLHGYQSSNVLSTNSPQWRTKFDYTSSHLTFSSTLVSINQFARSVHQIMSYSLFHLPKQQPQLELSASPSQLSGIVCHAVRETSSQPQFLRRLKGYLLLRFFGYHGYPAPLYRCRNWQWIYGAVYNVLQYTVIYLLAKAIDSRLLRLCWLTGVFTVNCITLLSFNVR